MYFTSVIVDCSGSTKSPQLLTRQPQWNTPISHTFIYAKIFNPDVALSNILYNNCEINLEKNYFVSQNYILACNISNHGNQNITSDEYFKVSMINMMLIIETFKTIPIMCKFTELNNYISCVYVK